jgi:hypothetical protein
LPGKLQTKRVERRKESEKNGTIPLKTKQKQKQKQKGSDLLYTLTLCLDSQGLQRPFCRIYI